MSSAYAGVSTAIITPFLPDRQIDWPCFERLLDKQVKGGVSCVVISGTTGESPTLSVQEKLSLVRKARALLPRDVKVMAGTGGNNTEQSVELSKLAVDAGADSLLVVTPPYNKPSLNGLVGHFEAISQATNVPICLYHVPARTGQTLTAAAIARVCTVPRVGLVKEASANLELFSDAKIAAGPAVFLSGDDGTYLASLAVGGRGVISVLTNIFPKAFKSLTDFFNKGESAKALAVHEALLPFIKLLFCETNPGPIKAALALKGLCQNVLRLPLAPVTADSAARLKESLTLTERKLRELGLDE